MMTSNRRVLILSRNSKADQKFVAEVKKYTSDVDLTLTSYLNLDFFINKDGLSIKLHDSDVDISKYDLVYFKTRAKYQDLAASIAAYLKKRGVRYIDTAAERHLATSSKLLQYVIFSEGGVNAPAILFMLRDRLRDSYDFVKENLGLPFILKDNHGNKGKLNYLITDKASFDKAIEEADKADIELVAQHYISNDGDYRILVFGNKVYMVIHRTKASEYTHLNNLSTGGTFKLVEVSDLPEAVIKQTIKSCELTNIQIAGVDMVKDANSENWYCLEVNDNPQITSGVLINEKQRAFAKFLDGYIV